MRSAVSLLPPCLLLLLSERPRHGYALLEHLCFFDMMLLGDPGTVYRALRSGNGPGSWRPCASSSTPTWGATGTLPTGRAHPDPPREPRSVP